MNENILLKGACLCGDVTYQSSQKHDEIWNCHCHSCRKANSVAYATWIKTRVSSFKWLTIKSPITKRYSSPTMQRSFCSRCGSILPAYSKKEGSMFLPAGGITNEHSLVPSADLHADEMPLWHTMPDQRRRDTKPVTGSLCDTQNSVLHTECPDRKTTGSCLCGAIKYSVSGEADAIRGCHCSRCRQRSGSAYFTGMPVLFTDFEIDGDENNITSFFLAGSQYYGYRFCRTCGTLVPSIFPDGKRTVIAAGSLDSTPPVRLMFHIYYASKAPWLHLSEKETCFDEHPPSDFDWRKVKLNIR